MVLRGCFRALSICSVVLSSSLASAQQSEAPKPLRLAASAFGQRAAIEIRDLPRSAADSAIRHAFTVIADAERLTDPDAEIPGGIGRLNAAAGGEPVPLEPSILDLLDRAHQFCRWTEGALGPLGGRLYQHYGLRPTTTKTSLGLAIQSARCDRLELDLETGQARLAEGSRVDLLGFARGYAVDLAVDSIREAGARNGLVAIGEVLRGFGDGPGGLGWQVLPPEAQGMTDPLPSLWLRDAAFTAASGSDRPPGASPEAAHAYYDLRSGQESPDMRIVLSSTELAVDSQAVAVAMFVIGSRIGQYRLGSIEPSPSVMWVVGDGEGAPLLVEYNWGEVRRK